MDVVEEIKDAIFYLDYKRYSAALLNCVSFTATQSTVINHAHSTTTQISSFWVAVIY